MPDCTLWEVTPDGSRVCLDPPPPRGDTTPDDDCARFGVLPDGSHVCLDGAIDEPVPDAEGLSPLVIVGVSLALYLLLR